MHSCHGLEATPPRSDQNYLKLSETIVEINDLRELPLFRQPLASRIRQGCSLKRLSLAAP